MKNSHIINIIIIRFITIIIALIFCINACHHSSRIVTATTTTTISSANIINISEHSNLEALIVPCTNTQIRDLYFPDTVLYLTANSGHYNAAGYDSSNTDAAPARLTTTKVCENLTIGPNVTVKQVYLDRESTPCIRHLKIINTTTRVLYLGKLRYDCLLVNSSSSTIPMNNLPSVEVRDSNILYHSDYQVTNDLMLGSGGVVLAAAYFQLRDLTPPLSHLTLEGNNFECLAPMASLTNGWVSCVLIHEITLNGKLNFNNNKITSGIRAYQQYLTSFSDPFRAGLNFRNNEIVENSRHCRDTLAKNQAENRCVAYFELYRDVRFSLVFVDDFQPLEYYPASDLLSEVPTTQTLSHQSPWVNMSSNSFTKIVEGNISHRDRFCVAILRMNVTTHHLLDREESETNDNSDVRYRPFLVNNNNFFIDYDNAEFVALPPGSIVDTADPILLSYFGSEQYSAFTIEDNTLPLNLIQISRNRIDMKRAGKSSGIIVVTDVSKGHLNCYRHYGGGSSSSSNSNNNNNNNNPGVIVDNGLFEISDNSIFIDTRTKAALTNSRSSPSSFVSTSAFAVIFFDQMNTCDKISVRDNNASIHLYRPIEVLPSFATIAQDQHALITVASQGAFCQFASAVNMGTIEFVNNNLVLDAQLDKGYMSSVAMFVAPDLNVFDVVRLFSLRNNRATMSGQSQAILLFALELSKTVDFDSFEAIGNFLNATEIISQPCAKCGLLSFLPEARSLGKKLQTQNRGLVIFNSRGLSFVNITRNEIWFKGGLTRGPEAQQTAESDTAPTLLASWAGAFEETIDTVTSWTLIGNKMIVLQSDKVRPESVVNLLQQSSNPNGGLVLGPFTRSISLHLEMRDNTLEFFAGTVNFLTFTSSLNPPSNILVENNSVTRNLQGVNLDRESTFESDPSVTQSVADFEVTSASEGRREPIVLWRMLPARSFFVRFMGRFVPPPSQSSSSSSSLSIRNNIFKLTNSFEQFLHFAVCAPTSHFAAVSDKYHSSSCLDSSNTSVEHNQVNLHQIVQKKNGGENEISFLRLRVKQTQPPPFPLPTVVPDNDDQHEPGKILFDSNNITFRQTSWRNPVNNNNNNPSLCTLATQSDLNPAAAVHDQSQAHSSINYVDNNISTQEGCEVASLFDLQSYGHQKTEFTFERNNVLRSSSMSSSSSTTTALMSVNETAASDNLQSSSSSSSNSRNRLLVNLSFHLNNIFSSSIVKSSNNNDNDNEESKIVDITSYSKKETVLPSLRRNFTKVDISAVNNVCNLMFIGDSSNLMKDDDSSRTTNNESIRSTAFRKSPFISVPDLEDRKCEPLPTDTPSKPLSLSESHARSLTRTVANIEDDDNNDDISTHDQTLATSTDVLQGIGIGAVAAAAAVVPSLGFGIARQQAMLNFVQSVRSGNCAGVKAVDGVPAADSPTQMSIGESESRFFVGGVAGNFLLSFLLVVFGEVGGALILWKSKSSSWNKPFAVFARCNVALILFVCSSLLLAPTLTFGLVALTQSDVTLGEKVLAAIFSLLGFAVPAFGYAFWSLHVRTNRTQEQYRKVPREGNAKNASKLKKFITYWFEGEGEWMIPRKATLEENLQFDAATPLIEGYNSRAKWFGLAEFVVMFGLALAPFCANLSPVEKSCVTQFAVLLVVLTGFLLLCLFFRPFQELFNRIAVPVVTLCEIAVIVIAYVFAENPPPFIMTLAVLTSSLQSFMAVIVLIASLSPLTKHIMRAWKRFSRKVNNKNGSRNSTKHQHHQQGMSLQDLLNDDEDEELKIVNSSDKKKDSSRDDNNTTRSSQKHHDQEKPRRDDQEKGSTTRTKNSHARARDQEKDHRDDTRRHRSDSTRDVNRSNNHSYSRTRSDNNNDDKYRSTRDSGSRHHQHQHSSSSSSPRRREERRTDERRPRHHEEKASSSSPHHERRDRSSSRREPSSSSARRDYPVDRPYTPSSSNRKEKESRSNRLHTSSSSPNRRHGNDTTPSTSSHRHHRQQSPSDHHNTTKRREKFAEI